MIREIQRLALALLTVAALPVVSARAQAQTGTGEIAGTITDSARVPLADADVFLRGATRRVRTDSAGAYHVTGVRPGSYTLIARKVGYRFEEAEVAVRAGATVRQDFSLGRRVVLPTVQVTARAECPLGTTIEGFFCRQERGGGAFLDYPEIDYYAQTYTADIFRHIRGFRVATRRTASGWTEPVPVHLAGNCVLYVVDGQVTGWDAVPVNTKDVTAIEVYVRPDTVPPEIRRELLFSRAPSRLPGGSPRSCDAVVIWTRRAGS